ncbi:MAG: PEP-CTERM sorting domain-containing protein [Puniceicoccaceae bacterium]
MKNKTSTSHLLATCVLALSGATALNGAVNSFSDITQWVGTGSNEAALVIDFNDGSATDSFAWGYRWDDPGEPVAVSGADMILAIAEADPNLSISHGGTAEDGFFVTEISYKGFSATSGDFVTNFDYWNYLLAGGTTGVSEFDPDYVPGAPLPQTWNYPNGGASLPGSWEAAKTGASDFSGTYSDAGSTPIPGRRLADGSWDAWVFGSEVDSPSGPIAPAPEPETAGLFLAIGAALLVTRRRRG